MVGWHDPLYVPRTTLPGTGTAVTLAGVAVELAITDTAPDVIESQWMDDREVTLQLTDVGTDDSSGDGTDGVTGDGSSEAFARLLGRFTVHATELADRPTTAGFALPSRDVVRGRIAREAGYLPASVLAVADLRRPADDATGLAAAACVVRDAAPNDAAALAALWNEQAEFEAAIGTLRTSAAIRRAIEEKAAACITGPATVLVAEAPTGVGDGLVGAVVADAPADSAWAATRLTLQPTSYLSMASTSAGVRSRGIGAALVRELHRRHRDAGLAASTLHYSAFNPLSVPFWSQRGYRPLVTIHARRVRSARD